MEQDVKAQHTPSDAAMKVWREALDATGAFIRFKQKPDQAAAAVIERAIADAVAQERARIVEWLQDTYCSRDVIDVHRLTAAIERGDHKERADG